MRIIRLGWYNEGKVCMRVCVVGGSGNFVPILSEAKLSGQVFCISIITENKMIVMFTTFYSAIFVPCIPQKQIHYNPCPEELIICTQAWLNDSTDKYLKQKWNKGQSRTRVIIRSHSFSAWHVYNTKFKGLIQFWKKIGQTLSHHSKKQRKGGECLGLMSVYTRALECGGQEGREGQFN